MCVGSILPLRSSLMIALRKLVVSSLPKLEFIASVVMWPRSFQKMRMWLTVNPSIPGLEAPFMWWKSAVVSSLCDRSPSIVSACAYDSFFF